MTAHNFHASTLADALEIIETYMHAGYSAGTVHRRENNGGTMYGYLQSRATRPRGRSAYVVAYETIGSFEAGFDPAVMRVLLETNVHSDEWRDADGIGWWVDENGVIWVEFVTVVGSPRMARHLATATGQRYVYDAIYGKTIATDHLPR